MTLRLNEADHDLLKLLTIVKRQSANEIIIGLLRAEFDRVLPGKLPSAHQPGSAVDRLREALGLAPLRDDPRLKRA